MHTYIVKASFLQLFDSFCCIFLILNGGTFRFCAFSSGGGGSLHWQEPRNRAFGAFRPSLSFLLCMEINIRSTHTRCLKLLVVVVAVAVVLLLLVLLVGPRHRRP